MAAADLVDACTSQKRSHSNVIIVECQVVPALSLRTVYASHSGNDAYKPQIDHALCEQPALRQEQRPSSSVGSRYQLLYRGWAAILVAVAQLTTSTLAMTHVPLSRRCASSASLVLILDRPPRSFVDRYDAARTCAITRRVWQHRSACRPASYPLTYSTWPTSYFLWVLPIGCG